MAQTVKRLPKMRETQVRSLGQEDPLEKGMATHSSTAAWKIPWTEEPGRRQSMGSQRVGHDERLHFTSLHFKDIETFEFRWLSSKEPTRQCRSHRRHGFSPWVRKIPWRRKW